MKTMTPSGSDASCEYATDEDGVRYERSKDPEWPSFWVAYGAEPSRPYVCVCGNDRLWIKHTGDYETSGECPECGFRAVVHDG